MKIMKFPSLLRRWGLLFLGLLMIATLLFGWQAHTPAQITVNLQTDINNLRSQVSVLRSEVAQLRQQRGYASVPAPAPSSSRRSRSPELSDQQMLDRLATLAIEAKERLNALESRVGRIENRFR
jgi:polyhydroxyalkanoate synthesis regulator phasin